MSYLFYRLERRVRSLVQASEDALGPLQDVLAKATQNPSLRIVDIVRHPRPGAWLYSRVFRQLFVLTGTAFALGVIYASWKLTASSSPLTGAFAVAVQLLVGATLGAIGIELLNSPISKGTEDRSETLRGVVIVLSGAILLIGCVTVLIHLVFFRLS